MNEKEIKRANFIINKTRQALEHFEKELIAAEEQIDYDEAIVQHYEKMVHYEQGKINGMTFLLGQLLKMDGKENNDGEIH